MPVIDIISSLQKFVDLNPHGYPHFDYSMLKYYISSYYFILTTFQYIPKSYYSSYCYR